MTDPIKGKVTNIIDSYTIALNVGANHGVQEGMEFKIIDRVVSVVDPDTGAELGKVTFSKAIVRIKAVYEKYSLAETFDTYIESNMPIFTFSRSVRKTLPLDPATKRDREETVKVGDEVVEIVREAKTS